MADATNPAEPKDAAEAPNAPVEESTTEAVAEHPAIPATEAVVPEVKRSAKPAAAKRTKAARRVAKPAAVRKEAARNMSAAKVKPARKPAAKKTKPVRAGVTKEGVETMTKATDAGLFAADQFRAVFGDVNERTKATMERGAKIVEELADLTRGNVEALVASSKVAAKGIESLSQDAAEYSRKSFEEASTALKSLAEVKSATDLFKLQGDYARAAFDAAIAESARVSETVLKIAGDVAEPITSRYTVAAERVKTLAA